MNDFKAARYCQWGRSQGFLPFFDLKKKALRYDSAESPPLLHLVFSSYDHSEMRKILRKKMSWVGLELCVNGLAVVSREISAYQEWLFTDNIK